MKNKRGKKLVVIGSMPPPFHGSNIYLSDLLSSRIKDIFKIRHLNTSDYRNDLDNLGKFDIINIFIGIKNLAELLSLCLDFKPKLTYLCPAQGPAYWRDGLFIIMSKIFSRAKIIQHLHGADFYNFYLRSNWFLKRFIDVTQKRVDRTIVLGNSLKYIFSRWHDEQEIDVVPNGIDLHIDINGKYDKSGLPVLYFLGNLLKFKGIHIAVQALALAKKKFPQIQMKIAGNWAFDPVFNESQEKIRNEIEQIIETERLQSNIQFLGPVYDEKKIDLLATSDVLVYPSMNDGLPLVILESMAAGNVVIAIDGVGAISDVVHNNETGILVNNQNPEEFAKAIEFLIINPDQRIRMGLKAYERYKNYYTKEHHINKMIEVFNKTLATNG